MKKTLLILTALASLTIANVKAQYYNYDVTVHYDDFNETLRILHERTVELQQQKIQEFYNLWNYRLNKVQKAVWFYAVPGLRAAVAHNDWAAALSFWLNWESQEMAYQKRYHTCSPSFLAASKAGRIQYGLEKK